MTRVVHTEVRRFLIVGLTTVAIDFAIYSGLLLMRVEVSLAKAIGFLSGMVFAWFANQRYTFSQVGGYSRVWSFVLLYVTTLGLNVLANRLSLSVFGSSLMAYVAAYVIATGLSATSNFLGMKFIVFRSGTTA